MANGTSYSTVNSLDEFTLIGGNDFTIIFNVVDEAGLPVNLTNAEELSLKISPYGQPTSVLMTLSGIVGETNDVVKFSIPANLSERMIGGKYMYQPIIKDAEGKQHRPKQGTFLLVQSIGAFTDLVDVPSSAFYIYATGTNNYSAESDVITQYYEGLTIILHVENTNTITSDLTFNNAPGTKDIQKVASDGSIVNLSPGDLVEGRKYLLVYDGIRWLSVSNFDGGSGGSFYVYATGTNSYTGTSTEINQYFDGLSAIMYFQNTNTGTSTLTLPGVAGTKSLMKFNSSGSLVELSAGDILQNKKYLFVYDGTQWVYVGYFPSEISHIYAKIDSPVFTGTPQSTTASAGDSTTRIATTAFVTSADNLKANLASPTFTGTPTAPTASAGTNTTQIATTAFVNTEIENDRPYSITNPSMNGTAAQGISPHISRQDHVHPTDTNRLALDGWIPGSGTWVYVSADAPTFVFNVPSDVTGLIQAGYKIKLTQTTVKYFIVTAVGAFSGGNTPITVYGGTDYTLTSEAITNPSYSPVKAPFGFPLNPDKWTVMATDTTTRTKTSPAVNTFYNAMDSGNLPSISLPIGIWNVSYKGIGRVEAPAGSTFARINTTLSTSGSSESDPDFTVSYSLNPGAATTAVLVNVAFMIPLVKTLVIAAKTTYYLLVSTGNTGANSIQVQGGSSTSIIKAVSAYL